MGSAQENASVSYDLEPGLLRVSYINLEIDTNGMVYVSEEAIVRGGDIVGVLLPQKADNVVVYDSSGIEISSELTLRDGKQLLSFFSGGAGRGQEEKVVINYTSQGFTGKSGDTWTLNYSSTVTPLGSAPQGTIIKLYTPKNTQITNIDYKDFYWSPVGDSEIWIYPLTHDFSLVFNYKLGVSGPLIPRPTSTTLPSGNNTIFPVDSAIRNYVVPFIAFLAFLLVVIWTLLFKKRSKEKGREPAPESPLATINDSHHASDLVSDKPETGHEAVSPVVPDVKYSMKPAEKVRRVKDSVKSLLDETEKRVIEVLEGFEEETTQAYVYKSTGIPKSSLSDAIRRLEKRNILDRKKEGRTNWLKLKETIFE